MLTRRLAGVCLSTSRPYDREKKDHRRATNTKGHLTSNAKTGEIKVADTGNVASIVTALFNLDEEALIVYERDARVLITRRTPQTATKRTFG
jgi:hypothetical protein